MHLQPYVRTQCSGLYVFAHVLFFSTGQFSPSKPLGPGVKSPLCFTAPHTIALQKEAIMTVSSERRRPHHLVALGDVNLHAEGEYDINISSSLWLLPRSPGHPAWWSLQPGSHARGFGSEQQSRNDHSSWLAEKMAKPA